MVKVIGITKNKNESQNSGHCTIWKIFLSNELVSLNMKDSCDLMVRNGHEMKERQSNHESNHRIFIDDFDFFH